MFTQNSHKVYEIIGKLVQFSGSGYNTVRLVFGKESLNFPE